MQDLPSFNIDGLDGSPDLLGGLRGKVCLLVNVASRCGYTPQYAGLERLHRDLAEQNFSVVGFPCNQFGAQEPGTAAEILAFCAGHYGVTFPLSAKIEVTGAHAHPLYVWLTAAETGFPGEISWNFEKFLIDSHGRVMRRYPSATQPEDAGLLQDIADALAV